MRINFNGQTKLSNAKNLIILLKFTKITQFILIAKTNCITHLAQLLSIMLIRANTNNCGYFVLGSDFVTESENDESVVNLIFCF